MGTRRSVHEAASQGDTARAVRLVERGDYPFATAHVDNVIEAIELALQLGEGGRAYFIGDREVGTFREFISLVADTHGTSIAQLRSAPYWLADLIARGVELFPKVTRDPNDPPISRSLVRMIGREFTIDDSAARNDLGYVGKTSRAVGRQMYLDAVSRQVARPA